MRLDHVSYAAESDGLHATAERLKKALGVDYSDGGVHPRFGTRNLIFPLARRHYVEVVEALDHPASDKAPFGQAVRARSEAGGGWMGWVVAVDDITGIEENLGRESVPGNRHRPDGVELRWRQIGIKGLLADPQLPYVIEWRVPEELHPSNGAKGDVGIRSLEIAGDPARVRDWLGLDPNYQPQNIDFTFVAPHGQPGLMSVTFSTPAGDVTV
ncbi:MAG: VOC family protein [Actinomycetes bacterium]